MNGYAELEGQTRGSMRTTSRNERTGKVRHQAAHQPDGKVKCQVTALQLQLQLQ